MSLSHSPKIVTDGLVLLLDAANPKSYPGSGTTWYDISGNGYTFTTSVAPTFITDSNGQKCFDFTNGSHQYFQSTSNSPFSGNSFAITVIASVNQNSTGSYLSVLSQNYNSRYNCMSFLSLSGKFGTDHWQPNGMRMDSTAPLNEVLHIAWVIPLWGNQTTNQTIYMNGVSRPISTYSSGATGSLISSPFTVGNWQIDRSDMDWDGQIYNVQVYNRALSEEEVKQNFNALRGRFGI